MSNSKMEEFLQLDKERREQFCKSTEEMFTMYPQIKRAISEFLEIPIMDIKWEDLFVDVEADAISIQITMTRAGNDMILYVPAIYTFTLDDVAQDDAQVLINHLKQVESTEQQQLAERVIDQLINAHQDPDLNLVDMLETDIDSSDDGGSVPPSETIH